MRAVILLLAALLLPGCATIGELIEGDFDSREEYRLAVDEVVNEYNISEEDKAELREDLYPLWDKANGIANDWDQLREAIKIRIVQWLAGK